MGNGVWSNRVERSDLVAGDHVYTWRAAFTYAHHGIYVGEDKVIHFNKHTYPTSITVSKFMQPASMASSRTNSTSCARCEALASRNRGNGVIISCLNCFVKNGALYRFTYGVSKAAFVFKIRGGTCNMAESDASDVVLKRALSLLESGFGDYDVLTNNCEDFASYCKTGDVCNREPFAGFCQVSSVFGVAAAGILSLSERMAARQGTPRWI